MKAARQWLRAAKRGNGAFTGRITVSRREAREYQRTKVTWAHEVKARARAVKRLKRLRTVANSTLTDKRIAELLRMM